MRYFLISFILFLLSLHSFAQTNADTIVVKKSFWNGASFYLHDQKLKPDETRALLKTFPASQQELRIAERSAMTTVLLICGGAGVWLGGVLIKNVNVQMAGAGITVLSLPFSIRGNHYLKKSIGAYNDQLRIKN